MRALLPLLGLAIIVVAREATAQNAPQDPQCVRERAAMVETIRAYARSAVSALEQQGLSERVLEAMEQTKRHLFIPERSCSIGYADRPVPIGFGQTMSQPYIVALMTQLAEVAPDHVVLEVGTGSGYQAAILSHLARKVCTIGAGLLICQVLRAHEGEVRVGIAVVRDKAQFRLHIGDAPGLQISGDDESQQRAAERVGIHAFASARAAVK